ncbi:MAG: DUF3368 domain-containing protein [Thermoguttaceae bacterium]
MPEILCNTSPLQYLHQIDAMRVLKAIAGRIVVPPAVAEEIAVGRRLGLDLPDLALLDWVALRRPASTAALPLVTDLGRGESEVLALALETPGSISILDDALARRFAQALGIKITGTLGILLDAKKAGLVDAVAPLLDRLQDRGFRLATATRAAVLRQAGELAG